METLLLTFIVAFLFSLVTLIPEIRAFCLLGARWAPILPPPIQLGDDYHYFSLLKKIDLKIADIFKGRVSNYSLPNTVATQIFGFLLVWPVYLIFSTILDRRFGIVAVRFLSRFLLAILAQLVCLQVLNLTQGPPQILLPPVIFLAAFVISGYPTGGLLRNVNNPRHLFDRSYTNEMVRGFAAESTTPPLLFGAAVALASVGNADSAGLKVLALSWLVLVGFVYPPTFFAQAVFQITLYGLTGLWGMSLSSAVLLVLIGLLIAWFLREDRMSAGMIYSTRKGVLPTISGLKVFFRTNVLALALMSALLLILTFAEGAIANSRFSLLVVVAALAPLIFGLSVHSHLARAWDRGAAPLFLVVSLTVAGGIVIESMNDSQEQLFLILTITLLTVAILRYYLLQQGFIVSSGYMEVSVPESQVISTLASKKTDPVATESPVAGLWLDLYSAKASQIANYSTQNSGYKGHVPVIVRCLKQCGWSEDEVVHALSTPVEYSDWVHFRPVIPGSEQDLLAFYHTLQYIATNREYNQDLVADKMYSVSTGWTPRFKDFLRNCYRED